MSWFAKIALRRRHALMVKVGALSHKIDYVTNFLEILNLKGHSNCTIVSKVTAILLNGWILPIGGASSGRVCSCSLRSRLVSNRAVFYRRNRSVLLFSMKVCFLVTSSPKEIHVKIAKVCSTRSRERMKGETILEILCSNT